MEKDLIKILAEIINNLTSDIVFLSNQVKKRDMILDACGRMACVIDK